MKSKTFHNIRKKDMNFLPTQRKALGKKSVRNQNQFARNHTYIRCAMKNGDKSNITA